MRRGCRCRKVRPWQPELNGDWPAIPYLVRGTRPSEIQSLPSLGYIKHIQKWRIFSHIGRWVARNMSETQVGKYPCLVAYLATWKEGECSDRSAWLQVAMVCLWDGWCPWHADLVLTADFSIDLRVAEGICWDWWPVQIHGYTHAYVKHFLWCTIPSAETAVSSNQCGSTPISGNANGSLPWFHGTSCSHWSTCAASFATFCFEDSNNGRLDCIITSNTCSYYTATGDTVDCSNPAPVDMIYVHIYRYIQPVVVSDFWTIKSMAGGWSNHKRRWSTNCLGINSMRWIIWQTFLRF